MFNGFRLLLGKRFSVLLFNAFKEMFSKIRPTTSPNNCPGKNKLKDIRGPQGPDWFMFWVVLHFCCLLFTFLAIFSVCLCVFCCLFDVLFLLFFMCFFFLCVFFCWFWFVLFSVSLVFVLLVVFFYVFVGFLCFFKLFVLCVSFVCVCFVFVWFFSVSWLFYCLLRCLFFASFCLLICVLVFFPPWKSQYENAQEGPRALIGLFGPLKGVNRELKPF